LTWRPPSRLVLAQAVDQPVVQLDEGDGHLAREQMHVVAWIPDERDPLVIAGHVAALSRQQQPGRVVLGVQVRRADRPGAVQTLQVGPRHSEVAGSVGIGAVRHRRAVSGDVVGHELPEERPHRRDVSVDVIGEVDAQVARAAGRPSACNAASSASSAGRSGNRER
jgi:hypothetical protein